MISTSRSQKITFQVFTVKSDDPIASLAQVPLLLPIVTIAWWFISGSIKELGKIFTFSGLGSLLGEILVSYSKSLCLSRVTSWVSF